jgi:hypothetical protein
MSHSATWLANWLCSELRWCLRHSAATTITIFTRPSGRSWISSIGRWTRAFRFLTSRFLLFIKMELTSCALKARG